MRRVGWLISLQLIATMLASAASLAQAPSPPPQAQGAPPPAPQAPQPAVAAPAPLAVRVEAIPTVELKSTPSSLSLKDFAPSLGAVMVS